MIMSVIKAPCLCDLLSVIVSIVTLSVTLNLLIVQFSVRRSVMYDVWMESPVTALDLRYTTFISRTEEFTL